MDKETLYWVLSTLPQVSAALVAFIGFLALQSLEEPRRRRAEFEGKSRKHVLDYTRERGKNFVEPLTWFQIEVMSSDDLARRIDALASDDDTSTVILRDYRKAWRIADQQINCTQKVLTVFVSIDLLVIGGTLSLIPYIPRLAGYPWIEEAVVATALLIVVTVAIMIFVALKGSPNLKDFKKTKK